MIAKPPSPAATAVSAGPPFAFTEINNRPCVIASFRVYTVYRTYCPSATRQRSTLSVPNRFRRNFFSKKKYTLSGRTRFYYVVTRSAGPNTRASSQHSWNRRQRKSRPFLGWGRFNQYVFHPHATRRYRLAMDSSTNGETKEPPSSSPPPPPPPPPTATLTTTTTMSITSQTTTITTTMTTTSPTDLYQICRLCLNTLKADEGESVFNNQVPSLPEKIYRVFGVSGQCRA